MTDLNTIPHDEQWRRGAATHKTRTPAAQARGFHFPSPFILFPLSYRDIKVKFALAWSGGGRDFLVLLLLQLFIYFLFSVNARALAQGLVAWTVFSDLIYSFFSYKILRKVNRNDSGWGEAGYVLGGAWGSALAIYVTRYLFGH